MAKRFYFINLHLWHDERTQYGIAMHHTSDTAIYGNRDEIKEQLKKYADNVENVKIDCTINGITINTDKRHIIQYSGYSNSKGMYCIVL